MQDARKQQQIELERLFNKNQLIPRIRKEFTDCKEVDFRDIFMANQIDEDLGFALLVQLALHKRCSLPTMVGILRHHMDDPQDIVDQIYRACVADLCHWHPVTKQLVVAITISEDVQQELDMYQFPLPMVVEPREVRSNRDTGYLSHPVSKGSLILKKNHHEDDICLDHINRMNRVKFALDMDTANMIQNQWRNLDRPKEGESIGDYEKRVRAFDKYDRTAKAVMAEVQSHGEHFYLTHKYDKRGRVYCQGYHVTYQGAPWNKAVIQLADKELVE